MRYLFLLLILFSCRSSKIVQERSRVLPVDSLSSLGLTADSIDLTPIGVNFKAFKVGGAYVVEDNLNIMLNRGPKKVTNNFDFSQNSHNKTNSENKIKNKGNKDKSKDKSQKNSGNKVKDNHKVKNQFPWPMILIAIIVCLFAVYWKRIFKFFM